MPEQHDPPPVGRVVVEFSQEELDRADGIMALTLLFERYGAESVIRWTRNIAATYGRDLQ